MWWFARNPVLAFAILAMIGLHEGGHLVFARFFGLKTGGFYFLPGLGGASFIKEQAKTRWIDFWVWFGGPFVGALLVLGLTGILYAFKDSMSLEHWAMGVDIVMIWSFINLLNLSPIFPLDGGVMLWSIAKSFRKGYSPWFALGVNVLAIALFFLYFKSIFWTVLLGYFGYTGIMRRHKSELVFCKEDMKWRQAVLCALAYVVLAVFFAVILVLSMAALGQIK